MLVRYKGELYAAAPSGENLRIITHNKEKTTEDFVFTGSKAHPSYTMVTTIHDEDVTDIFEPEVFCRYLVRDEDKRLVGENWKLSTFIPDVKGGYAHLIYTSGYIDGWTKASPTICYKNVSVTSLSNTRIRYKYSKKDGILGDIVVEQNIPVTEFEDAVNEIMFDRM